MKPAISIDSECEEFREFQMAQNHPIEHLEAPKPSSIFINLTNQILETLTEVEIAVEELMNWKDDLMEKSIPAEMKLDISLLFSCLFRSKSNLHNPLFELLKLVGIYSGEWDINRTSLLNLEQDFHRCLDVKIEIILFWMLLLESWNRCRKE